MDVDDEVFRDDSVLVFSDVFGAELHLASLDVIATLDEGRVEHDAAHRLTGEAHVLEEDLDIALNDNTRPLLLCQQKDHSVLALTIEFLGWVRELLSNVQTTTAVNFEEGNAATT